MADTINNNDSNPELDNVDQIREILFGSQTREANDKFEKLEASIKAIHNEMRAKFEQSQNDLDEKINNEIQSISKKIKNITSQQQNDFEDLKDNSSKLEKRLQNSIDLMDDEFKTKTEQLQKQQIDVRNTLRAQMDTLQDELLQVIDTKLSELSDVKLSRDSAAEILMEAAIAMKGTQINQQLSMATQQSK